MITTYKQRDKSVFPILNKFMLVATSLWQFTNEVMNQLFPILKQTNNESMAPNEHRSS